MLAKRKAYQHKRDEKEPTPCGERFSDSPIREDLVVKRCECLEDDRFHSARIFAPFPVFGEYAELRTNSIATVAVVC